MPHCSGAPRACRGAVRASPSGRRSRRLLRTPESAAARRLDDEHVAGIHRHGERRAEFLARSRFGVSRALDPVAADRARQAAGDPERRDRADGWRASPPSSARGSGRAARRRRRRDGGRRRRCRGGSRTTRAAPGSATRAPPGRSAANSSCASARRSRRRSRVRRRRRPRSSRSTGRSALPNVKLFIVPCDAASTPSAPYSVSVIACDVSTLPATTAAG